MKKKLTPKQQKAVDNFIVHRDKSKAYRHAYATKNMKPRTINRKAIDLFNLPHVKALTDASIEKASDGWTLSVVDKAPSAHFEYTLLVQEEGCEILAWRSNQEIKKSSNQAVQALRPSGRWDRDSGKQGIWISGLPDCLISSR